MKCNNCETHKYELNYDYCWRVWGLCGKCARLEHPHFYRRADSDTKLRRKRSNRIYKVKRLHKTLKLVKKEIDLLNEEIEFHENKRQVFNIETEERLIKIKMEEIAIKKMRYSNAT